MSAAVFPAFVGLKWDVKKTPIWNTRVFKTASGRTLRSTQFSSPLWKFSMAYDILREATAFNEIQQLAGFFNSRSGSFDSFYFLDPTENSVTDQQISVGVSGQLIYTFTKSWGGQYIEPIGALNGNPTNVKVGGVTKTLTTDYTVSGNKLTFVVQPTVGQNITWTGNFYYVLMFEKDMAEFDNFMYRLWSMQRLEMISVKP